MLGSANSLSQFAARVKHKPKNNLRRAEKTLHRAPGFGFIPA
jgi:hypothetical protein